MKSNFNDAVKYFQNGKISEAKNICLEILKSEPKDFNALHLLGIIAFQNKNYLKSVETIKKAIEINSDYPDAYNNLAIAFDHLNKFEDAIKCWDKAIEINPNYAEAYNNRGSVLIKLGKKNASFKDFEMAINDKFETSNDYLFKKYHQEFWSGMGVEALQMWIPIYLLPEMGTIEIVKESHTWEHIPHKNREPIEMPKKYESNF